MTRKLAHIEYITDIQPIPKADLIAVATVLGWKVVVKKGEFKVGDKVVYIEVDSIMPALPQYEFLKERKYRIRTIKLKGQVSQGLVLPLSSLPEGWKKFSIGQDVTEALGIVKYDPQAEDESSQNMSSFVKFMKRFKWYRKFFMNKKKGGFPDRIKKTDEERIQNIPQILSDYHNSLFDVTEKLDGQSVTFFLKKVSKNIFGKQQYDFGVCSRNLRLTRPDKSSWWTVAKNYHMEDVLKNLIGDREYVVLQGEILGTSIQGNKYGVREYQFYAFNLIYPEGNVTWTDMTIPLNQYGIQTVPILDVDVNLFTTVDDMVEMSKGKSYINPKIDREGLVIRNFEKGISFKVINPEFLLKNNE